MSPHRRINVTLALVYTAAAIAVVLDLLVWRP